MDKRLITQRQKIVKALKDAGADGMTNVEMNKISMRFGGHIDELYRQGYKIRKINLGGGLWRYFFISEPSQIQIPTNAHLIFMNEVKSRLGADGHKEVAKINEEFYFHTVRKNGWYLRDLEHEQMQMNLFEEH